MKAQRKVIAGGVLLVLVVTLVAVLTNLPSGQRSAVPRFTAQPQRNAIWDLPAFGRAVTAAQLSTAAGRGRILFYDPATPGFPIEKHFEVARELHAAAPRAELFEYFNVSYWYPTNNVGLAPYSSSFNTQWLLRDSAGAPVVFKPGGRPRAWVLDLANPGLRRWIVTTLVSWVQAAPYAGVLLDAADPIPDSYVKQAFGPLTFGELLCGVKSATCPRVNAWNAGLTSLLSEVRAALHPTGARVLYNGVAPSAQRVNRNLALMALTDGATNESFCYGQAAANPADEIYEPLGPDLTIMRRAAATKKILIEITNFGSDGSVRLAEYCRAAFLLGWQPGHSYQIFHRDYDDLGDPSRIDTPEARLDIGSPTSQVRQYGSVFVRTFTRGFVMANDSAKTAVAHVPASGTLIRNGAPAGTVADGAAVSLRPHEGRFYLTGDSMTTPG